jgi:hypothetical protein
LILLCGFDEGQSSVLQRILSDYDYIYLLRSSDGSRAAGARFTPGSFVARTNYNPQESNPSRASLQSLCIPKYSTNLLESPLEAEKIPLFGNREKVTAEELETNFGLPATAKVASSSSLVITNVDILSTDRSQMQEIRDKIGPDCRKIINANLASNRNSYQITSVLTGQLDLEIFIGVQKKEQYIANALDELRDTGFQVKSTANLEYVVIGIDTVYGFKWNRLDSKL